MSEWSDSVKNGNHINPKATMKFTQFSNSFQIVSLILNHVRGFTEM